MANKGNDTLSYGVMGACKRCSYSKSYEPILIFSKLRGPRVIINLESKTYVRHGECLGFNSCGKCFELNKDSKFPCYWVTL
jgi:hypothetical protein